jgi:hypothetical protein
MDKQKKIFERLSCGPFLANLATILFSQRKEKGDVFYASANYKVQEPNHTRPEEHLNHFEHDVIMVLAHCGERTYEGRTRHKIVNKVVVSVEIKTSVDDIWKSSIDKYLGATRLFFIAAPRRLLRAVLDRYRGHPRKEVIGIIDSDSSEVVVLPQVQDFQKDRCDRLLARCYTSEHRYPFCCWDRDLYGIHRVMENETPGPQWVDYNGLRVNPVYLNLFHR